LYGIALDNQGNLWAANYNANTIVEFAAAQLTASGSPSPQVTLSASGGSLNGPQGIGFDRAGNLWVVNATANNLVEFALSQLATSGSPSPKVTISASAGSLNSPTFLAFDASGNLWVTSGLSNTIVEYTPAQFAASGSPTPAITLSANAGSLSTPIGLAFDNSGDLWVSNDRTLVEFSVSQLATSGSPAPVVEVTSASIPAAGHNSLVSGAGIVFNPSAPNLPIAP
jgi:secreted PhoX family phosphatase